MGMRFFSPASARRALETIRPAAEAMCRLHREIDRNRPARIEAEQRVEPRYFELLQLLLAAFAALKQAGVEIKDARDGLIDFPARRAGRVVFLCWKVGEPHLGFWHEPGEGFAGRRRLDEDGPWEESDDPGGLPA